MNDNKDSITDLSEAFAPIVSFLESIFKWIKNNPETIAQAANKLHQHILFEQSGWLPHYTTPFGLMEGIIDAHSLTNLLERYYIDNWAQVKHEFRMHVAEMHVDEEAKDTFYEALEAHEHGLYRTTARTLFPEIERLARGSAQHNGSLPNIASLVEIRRAASNLGLRPRLRMPDAVGFGLNGPPNWLDVDQGTSSPAGCLRAASPLPD